jgi:hypothetical protein
MRVALKTTGLESLINFQWSTEDSGEQGLVFVKESSSSREAGESIRKPVVVRLVASCTTQSVCPGSLSSASPVRLWEGGRQQKGDI